MFSYIEMAQSESTQFQCTVYCMLVTRGMGCAKSTKNVVHIQVE